MVFTHFSHFRYIAQSEQSEFVQKGDKMFKENFIKACVEKNVSPTSICVSVGLSSATFSQWTENSVPRKTTLIKLADALGVTVDYLLGNEKEKPTLAGELSEAEKMILDLFRQIPEEQQDLVLQLIRAALSAGK